MPVEKSVIDRTLGEPYGEQAYRIVEILTDAGFDTWWAGGCVRDMLSNAVPKDIDIATAAHPKDILRLFTTAKAADSALGSVRVRMGLFVFEITTYRKESDTAIGRKPSLVSFGTREEDAIRRDFTVNALYVHPISRETYDPFDGEADLKERLIRFIGDPSMRILQDPLRMLRAVRMRARIDGQYHPDTFAALHAKAELVTSLSGTRQLEELEKLLLSPNGDRGLEDLWELDILERMIPELHRCKGIPQPADYHHEGDVWDHLLQCVRSFREDDLLDVRLATLFHDIGKTDTFKLKDRIRFDQHASVSADMAESILERMGMPLKRREKIDWLIRHHMMMVPLLEMNDERKTHWYHHPWFPELMRVFWLDIAGTTPSSFELYERIDADCNAFLDAHPRPVKPLLSGNDIMRLTGLKPSARIGEMLDALHDAQMRGEVQSRKEAESFILSFEDVV